MRALLVCVPLAAWACSPGSAPQSDATRGLNPAEDVRRLHGWWDEIEPSPDIKPAAGPQMRITWQFTSMKTYRLIDMGQVEQEIDPPVRIDLTTWPWHLDLVEYIHDGRETRQKPRPQGVTLGIFRLEGDRLIWVRGAWHEIDPKTWPKGVEKLAGRPKDFAAPPQTKQHRVVLRRSATQPAE